MIWALIRLLAYCLAILVSGVLAVALAIGMPLL